MMNGSGGPVSELVGAQGHTAALISQPDGQQYCEFLPARLASERDRERTSQPPLSSIHRKPQCLSLNVEDV